MNASVGYQRAGRLGAAAVIATVLAATAYGASEWHSHQPVSAGASLIARGDYSRAVRTLLPAVAAAPGNARAHYYLGLAYARIGIRQGAISHFREAVRLEPDGARFHAELGRASDRRASPSGRWKNSRRRSA